MTDVSCYFKKQFMSRAEKMFRKGVRIRTWVEIRNEDVKGLTTNISGDTERRTARNVSDYFWTGSGLG